MGDWAVYLPIVLGGIATLAIYSFLVKENPFYRFFEHLYIGIATGFGIVLGVQRFLWPQLFRPMLGYDREVFANGGFDRPWRDWYLFYLFPFAFGTLYYFIYSKKRQWLSRLVIAWSLGVAGGFAMKGFFAQYMPQIISSFKPLVAVKTVERDLMVRFDGFEAKLPEDAEITGGYLEMYRLGPTRARLVITGADGKPEEIVGNVLRSDAAAGTIQIEVDGAGKRDLKLADVILREDVAPASDTKNAYEGFGGQHLYKAYRLQRPWDAEATGYTTRFKGDGVAPGDAISATAESGTGLALLVRTDGKVRDVHRGEEWDTGTRDQVGWKKCVLSKDTLTAWFDRPESNFGLVLQRKDGVGGSLLHRFASSSNEDVAVRPRLVVEYTQPPPAAGGEPVKGRLVLQQGTDGYGGVEEAIVVQGKDSPEAAAAELMLGASALDHAGNVSVNWSSPKGTIANWIFMITLVCVMTYFLFSFEHSRPGIRHASQGGRWLMMICFGAFFGSTIMARMALLVERLQFLIEKWFPTIFFMG